MNTNKVLSLALAGTLAFLPLAGCGGNGQSTEATEDEVIEQPAGDETAADGGEQLSGGWTANTEAAANLLDEEQEVFAKALVGYSGMSFEPVSVLATQVVAGTNYAYLCKATPVTAEPTTSWAVVVVYNDLEDNASISNVTDLELGNVKTGDADAIPTDLDGGWQIVEQEAASLTDDAQAAFDAAAQSYEGSAPKPIALLGTQVVAGTNYMVLCEGESADDGATPLLYVAQVYQDLEGTAQFTDVLPLNLLEYV